MFWRTVATWSTLVALSVHQTHVRAVRTHSPASQTQLEASRVDESVAVASKVVVYSAEQLYLAVQSGQRYIELREHIVVESTIFTGQAVFLKGSCGQARTSPAAVDIPISFEQCTVSMGSISQPIMAAAFAPVWLSNIVIHSQPATGPQTAAISVSDGLLYMENSAILAATQARTQSISLRESQAFITGCTFNGGHAFRGGAIDSLSSSLVIANSTFQNNRAYGNATSGEGNGGAVHAAYSHIMIMHSDLLANVAERAGGALALRAPNLVTLAGDSFISNAASELGGAVALLGSTGQNQIVFEDCGFVTNEADIGADISVSSASTIVAAFAPEQVRAEASPGYQWAPLSPGEREAFAAEQFKPLLRSSDGWITSADLVFRSSSVAPPAWQQGRAVCAGHTGRNAAIIVLACLAVALLVCLCGACWRQPLLRSLTKGTPTSSESPRSSSVPSCVTSANSSETVCGQKASPPRPPKALNGSAGLPPPQRFRNGRSLPRHLSGTQAAAAAAKDEVVVQVIASDRLGWNGLPRQKREPSPSSPSPDGSTRPRSPWKVVLGLSGGNGSNKPVVPKPVPPEEDADAATRRSPRGSSRRAPMPPTPPELNTIDEGEEPSSRSIPMPGNTGTTDASGGAGTRSLSLQVPPISPSRSLHDVMEEYSSSGSFGSSEDLDVTPSNSTSIDGFSRDNLVYSPGGSRLSPRRGSTFSGTGDRRVLLTDVGPRPGATSTGPSSPERDVPRALLSEPTLKNAAPAQPPSRLSREVAEQERAVRRSGFENTDGGAGAGAHHSAWSNSVGRACAAVDADGCDPMLRSKSLLAQGHSDELIPQARPLDSGRALDSARSDAWRTLAGERMYGDGLDATSTFGSCSNTFFLVPPKSLSREGSGELAGDGDLRDGLGDAGRRASHGTRLRRMSDDLSREARAAMRGMRSTEDAG